MYKLYMSIVLVLLFLININCQIDSVYNNDTLLSTLKNGSVREKINAIEELVAIGKYVKGKAKKEFISTIIPGMVEAYCNERNDFVSAELISALRKIEPPPEIVIPAYIKGLNKGWEWDYEALTALSALKDLDYDLTGYVQEMVGNIKTRDERRIRYGFDGLKIMGRNAIKAIPLLEKIWEEDPLKDPKFKKEIEETIEIIKNDYNKAGG